MRLLSAIQDLEHVRCRHEAMCSVEDLNQLYVSIRKCFDNPVIMETGWTSWKNTLGHQMIGACELATNEHLRAIRHGERHHGISPASKLARHQAALLDQLDKA